MGLSVQERVELELAAWGRLREAAEVYDAYRGDWLDALLRDVLLLVRHRSPAALEVSLAAAAARADVRIRTGRLSQEQRLFAGRVRPLVSEDPA